MSTCDDPTGRAGEALRAVTDVALAALESTSSREAMRQVADVLLKVLGADNVLYHEFDRRGAGAILGIAPVAAWEALPLHGGPTEVIRRLHPGMDHLALHDVTRPFALTDLVGERQWRGHEMVTLMRPVWGRTLKLHIPVPVDDRLVTGWAATRDGRDYTREDLEVAEAVQPVLRVVALQFRAWADRAPAPGGAVLTEREHVVLLLAAEGLTAHAIGHRLGISARTVHKHLERLYRKLDASDRVSALRRAVDLGWVDLGSAQPRAATPAAVPVGTGPQPRF